MNIILIESRNHLDGYRGTFGLDYMNETKNQNRTALEPETKSNREPHIEQKNNETKLEDVYEHRLGQDQCPHESEDGFGHTPRLRTIGYNANSNLVTIPILLVTKPKPFRTQQPNNPF